MSSVITPKAANSRLTTARLDVGWHGRGELAVSGGGTFTIDGHAHLDGKLILAVDNEFEPGSTSKSIGVLSYSSHEDRFSAIEGPPGVTLEPVYGDDGFVVVLHAMREP